MRKVKSAVLHSSPQIVGFSNLKSQLAEVANAGGAIRDLSMYFDGSLLYVTINKTVEAAIPAANVISMVLHKKQD
jgi:hypothetical protein